ncbi:MAG TPA: hypothetical protein VK283_04965, partial [Acidimicrobiales bacterium]|nr:hypothetical protein [Acidimicrobiales bacterium]
MASATREAENGSAERPEQALEAGSEPVAAPSSGLSFLSYLAIYAYSATLALATAALLVRGPLHGAGPVRVLIPQPAMFAVLCVVWAAVLWAPVSVHHRGQTVLLALEDVPLLLGLVFLSPPLLVLASIVAAAFVFLVLRKQALHKVCFNVAAGGLGVAVSEVVYREILGSHSAVSLWGWGAAVVGLSVNAITTYVLVVIMARLLGQTTERRTRPELLLNAMLTTASVCLAIVVFDAAWMNIWATLPVFLVAALLIAAYRGYTRLSLRFASLQRLYDFSRALGTANLEPTSMSLEVLGQVCTVMR